MTALPPVANVVQLAFQVENTDSSYVDVNRLHFHYTGTPPTAGDLLSFATTCLTAYESAFVTSLAANKNVVGIVAIDLTSPTAATAVFTDHTAGTLAGALLPDDVAFVLSLTIARRYRGGHPRIYLPLGDATKLTNGKTWDSGFVTAVGIAAEGLLVAINGAGWAGAGTIAPVSVSYYFGTHLVTYPSGRHRDVPSLRVGGPVVDPVVDIVGRSVVGTQRRRLAR